jgi:hypothetical protein
LKKFNLYVEYQHSKQEHLAFALDLIQKDDFEKYLRFSWNKQIYEFQVLCFGLASAPRVFTKVLKPVYAFFFANWE